MSENKRNTLFSYMSSQQKKMKLSIDSQTSNVEEQSFVSTNTDSERDFPSFSTASEIIDKDERRYSFLMNIRDKNGVKKGDKDYDPTSLFISNIEYNNFTEFEKQFWDVKKENFDTIVFFKKGKFYELYEEDAEIGARLFDMRIAERVNMKMAGFPEKSYDLWSGKFLEKGYKIARVGQVENMVAKNMREREISGKKDKIIKRQLAEIITSGTIYNIDHLTSPLSIYLAIIVVTLNQNFDSYYVSVILYEASLNHILYESFTDDLDYSKLKNLVAHHDIKEVITKEKFAFLKDVRTITPLYGNVCLSFRDKFNHEQEFLAFKYLMNYMNSLKRHSFIDSAEILPIGSDILKYMSLDRLTLQNMEIMTNNKDGTNKFTLFELINKCSTPFGQRLLKKWLLHPLKCENEIKQRHLITQAIQLLPYHEFKDDLAAISDVERIIGKCCSVNPAVKDVINLMKNLNLANQFVVKFKKAINCQNDFHGFKHLEMILDELPDIDLILATFEDKYFIEEQEIMPQSESNDELCGLFENEKRIQQKLQDYLVIVKKEIGIDVKYRHLGKELFQLEFPINSILPEKYYLVSSTKQVKRYYTSNLKILINEFIECDELIFQSKANLLKRVIITLMGFKENIYKLSTVLAKIDVFFSFVTFAALNQVVYPKFKDNLSVKKLRNPIFPNFVENDINFNENNTLVLTGPNMGGKSTLMRSICYNCILAQIGMKVFADEFTCKIFDQIFTRMGASDNLLKGQSTFMVELSETSKILRHSTDKTLVILDELGRGTSINEGEAIAWAVLEYLKKRGCTLLFSTHYTKMVDKVTGVLKGFMDFELAGEDVVFRYKLAEGVSYNSHGIAVAKLAGLPKVLIDRAIEIRKDLLEKWK